MKMIIYCFEVYSLCFQNFANRCVYNIHDAPCTTSIWHWTDPILMGTVCFWVFTATMYSSLDSASCGRAASCTSIFLTARVRRLSNFFGLFSLVHIRVKCPSLLHFRNFWLCLQRHSLPRCPCFPHLSQTISLFLRTCFDEDTIYLCCPFLLNEVRFILCPSLALAIVRNSNVTSDSDNSLTRRERERQALMTWSRTKSSFLPSKSQFTASFCNLVTY